MKKADTAWNHHIPASTSDFDREYDEKQMVIDYLTDHVEAKERDFKKLTGFDMAKLGRLIKKLLEEEIIVEKKQSGVKIYKLKR